MIILKRKSNVVSRTRLAATGHISVSNFPSNQIVSIFLVPEDWTMKRLTQVSSLSTIPISVLFCMMYLHAGRDPIAIEPNTNWDPIQSIPTKEENNLLKSKTPQLQTMLKPLLDKVIQLHQIIYSRLLILFYQPEYWNRSMRVKGVCKKYGLRMEDKVKQQKALQKRASLPPERSLMYLPPFSLLYCWVHKAASTSWNKIFIQLAEKALNRTLIIPERNLHEVGLSF